VNGQERLVPLDQAKAQLQKQIAAEVRLQQAAERNKQLDVREAQIRQSEAALQAKLQQMTTPPSSPARDDADDADLEKESRDVVSGLFRGTEDEAAANLAKLLKGTRSRAPQTPQIDPNKLVEQTATVVRKQLSAEQLDRDAREGFAKFSEDYPELLSDPGLFAYADSLTTTIEAEHPEWKPSQVILEAGKRTKAWVDGIKGPTDDTAAPSTNDRRERKRQLRPMPRPASGREPASQPEAPETPGSVLAEMRKARGQAA
jgi:multidrug efflux pump subunit AcrA (membrane-fusion protein)